MPKQPTRPELEKMLADARDELDATSTKLTEARAAVRVCADQIARHRCPERPVESDLPSLEEVEAAGFDASLRGLDGRPVGQPVTWREIAEMVKPLTVELAEAKSRLRRSEEIETSLRAAHAALVEEVGRLRARAEDQEDRGDSYALESAYLLSVVQYAEQFLTEQQRAQVQGFRDGWAERGDS